MLRRALEESPGLEVSTFSWRRALLGRYDVFHVHWPEILATGRGPLRTLARQVLFLSLLVRLRVTRIPLVRTVHNLRPQEDVARRVRTLLRLTDRWTTLFIRLNEQTPVADGVTAVTVLHGHYRDWFAEHPRSEQRPGRLAFLGFIRPYKNVETLITTFRDTAEPAPEASLLVAGKPVTDELAAALRTAADGDPRISLRLEHVPDAVLAEEVGRAQLVVLPYREMHNSGAALMALSLDRPVLLPDNAVTAQLAAEVGPEWVVRYSGDLDAGILLDALASARHLPSDARPDLGRREWKRAGLDHRDAYLRAVALRRGRLRRRRAGA
jgi:glycosyltransferase involved in cell wall biosynthesis